MSAEGPFVLGGNALGAAHVPWENAGKRGHAPEENASKGTPDRGAWMEHVPKRDDVLLSEVLQGGIREDADGPRKATLAIRGDVCLASVGSKKTSVHNVLWGKRPPLESVSEETGVALQSGI